MTEGNAVSGGKPTRAVLHDRTAQEELNQLRALVAAANVGLWDWDLETGEVKYSTEWKRQIGYADHEISDAFSEWESRVHPDDLARTLSLVRAYVEKPWPTYEVEFRLRHRDGSYRWILTQASVLLNEQGKPRRMLGSHVEGQGPAAVHRVQARREVRAQTWRAEGP